MEFLNSSLFGDLTKVVQARFDEASKRNVELFDKTIYKDFLTWDTPTIGLDFEEIVGKYNLTVAAATIGERSNEPIIGSYGLETVKERVLNHAMTLPMDIATYRKILALLDSKSIPDQAKKQQLVDMMWGGVKNVVNAVETKLDIIFLSALSNAGIFTFDGDNNPEGGVRGTIDYGQPAENIASATKAWTEENLTTVDCFEDIMQILEASQDKTIIGKILCAPQLISYMCRSTKMKQLLWGSDKSGRIVQLKDINDYMESNGLPTFSKVQRQCKIQKGNTLTPYTPWNAGNMVFVPDGKLGVIKNAYSDNELKPEKDVTYSNYGRIRVSQWYVGETKGANHGEFTKAESMSLPVITEMPNIYTLKTQG